MKLTKLRLATVLSSLVIIGVAMTGCAGPSQSPAPSGLTGAPMTSIDVASPPGTLQAVPIAFGEAKGLYAKHNIDVKFVSVTGASALATALVSGSVNMSISAVSAIWPLANQDQPVVALLPTLSSYFNVIGQPDLNLQEPAKGEKASLDNVKLLKGKKIGVSALGLSAPKVLMDYLLKQAGLSPTDVTYIATGNLATSVAAFQQKQVDALVTTPPDEEYLGSDAFKYVANLADTGTYKGLLSGEVTTTKSYISSHRQAVTDMCIATKESYAYMKDPKNEKEAVAFLKTYLNLPSNDIAQQVWDNWNFSLIGDKPISEKLWKSASFWQAGSDIADYVPDFNTYVDKACNKA